MPTDADGNFAVRWARRNVGAAVGALVPEEELGAPPAPFASPRGVFVTLRRYPSGTLRGCIGFPLPRLPLTEGLAEAARAAATEDPRFPPVRPSELDSLTIEVSILTVPERVEFETPEGAIRAIRVGRDGLIVEARGTSGLLLPQVAPEQGWDAEQLLDGTCEKAGLPRGAWKTPGVRVLRFEADVFAETSPHGPIVREGEPITTTGERRARRT